MARYDVVVVGLGVMGSAATYHLARRGLRVLALDRFVPPHTLGSSHGKTRIIREAYFEHPAYVPLVRRAYDCWAALERDTARPLLAQTGGLMLGPPDGTLVRGARASAEAHGVAHEILASGDVRRRFPALAPPENAVAVLEERAGLLFAEACVEALHDGAARRGAALRLGEPVIDWSVADGGVRVRSAAGEYQADRLVLAAGPWLPVVLADLYLPLEVERQLFHWFEPAMRGELFRANRLPVVLWEYEADRFVAFLPDVGHGVKVGIHHEGELTDPDGVNRTVSVAEDDRLRALVRRAMPDGDGRIVESRVCLYTNTPDHHFIVDAHPAHPQVVIVSACSGHGFKFASALGEVVADMVTDVRSELDLSLFRITRFVESRSVSGATPSQAVRSRQ